MRKTLFNFVDWKLVLRLESVAWVIGLIYYGCFLYFPNEIMGQSLKDDPMAIYGFGALLCGILLSRTLQQTFEGKVALMFSSGAIQCGFESIEQFSAWFQRVAVFAFAIVLLTLVPLTLIGIYGVDSNETGKWHLMMGSSIGLWMVSTRFAHGVASGIAAYVISNTRSVFVLNPSHPDKSSGFGYLGYYYFEQALILLLPAAFMLFWIVFVGLNIGSLERSELVEQVEAIIEDREPQGPQINYIVDHYVICSDRFLDLSDCKAEDRKFIWFEQFVRLIIYNLLIFLFVWVTPSIFLQRRMVRSRVLNIRPWEIHLEKELLNERALLVSKCLSNERTSEFFELQQKVDSLSFKLAELRSTPTFPIPLRTAITAWISNISALVGLISLG